MPLRRPLLTLLGTCLLAQAGAAEPCPPAGHSRASLLELRQGDFAIEDADRRNQMAIALLACTGDPDPEIRDGIVYEGLATWLRGRQLAPETVQTLREGLLRQLRATDDANGFLKPFAALDLSEVVRSDRVDAVFTPAQREEIVEAADDYLRGVRDYRGFSETEGWRHGVAHGADLVLQLVLNPRIDAAQVRRLLGAVAAQVSPSGAVFYVYGEPDRLARAVFHAYRRGDLAASEWESWFHSIASPAPLGAWSDAWSTQAGLAKRHNTLAFLRALQLAGMSAADERGEAMAAYAMRAAQTVGG